MDQPKVTVLNTPEYREQYANSVQIGTTLWDFCLQFGTVGSAHPHQEITVKNFQTIYISPQQAKALHNVLGQNLAQYEKTFGTVNLEPRGDAGGVAASRPM